MHYDWLADEAYTKAFNDAEEMFRDSVRTEVHRRAVEGSVYLKWRFSSVIPVLRFFNWPQP
jgi:hypothetical protein